MQEIIEWKQWKALNLNMQHSELPEIKYQAVHLKWGHCATNVKRFSFFRYCHYFLFLKGWETWIKQKQHLRNVHNTAIHGFKFKQAFFFIYRFFIYRYIDSESLFILWMLKENTSHEMLNILPVSNACPWHYLDLPWSFKARSHQKQKLYQRPNQHMILLCLF